MKILNLFRPAVVLFLIFGSCAGSKEPGINTPELITWQLEFISGLSTGIDALYPEKKPVLIFNNSSMILHGYTGCNDFSVPFTSEGYALRTTGPGKQTMRACPGPGEMHFMQQLQAVDSFQATSDHLVLYGKKVPLMRFIKTTQE